VYLNVTAAERNIYQKQKLSSVSKYSIAYRS
jgi:hypothetical protein